MNTAAKAFATKKIEKVSYPCTPTQANQPARIAIVFTALSCGLTPDKVWRKHGSVCTPPLWLRRPCTHRKTKEGKSKDGFLHKLPRQANTPTTTPTNSHPAMIFFAGRLFVLTFASSIRQNNVSKTKSDP